MDAGDFDAIFDALNAVQVRYLVVGGVAVVLHGHPRFTADIDIVLSLERTNVLAALRALMTLGYRPRAPVNADDFAEADIRRKWIEEKGLTVFSFWSPEHPATEIDLFVTEPFPFDETYARATTIDLGTTLVRVLNIDDLIALKLRAGRPKDLEDVRILRALQEDGK